MLPINQSLRDEINLLHAEICGGLADPTRILILYSLADQSRSVSEIVNILELNQSTVSRHLQVLRTRKLVTATRDGQNVYYSLTDHRVIEALDLLRSVLGDQINHQASLVDKAAPSTD